MGKRTSRPPADPPRPPALTMSRQSAADDLGLRIDKSQELRTRIARDGTAARSEYDAWHNYNVQMLTRMFTDPSIAEEYRYCGPGRVLSLGGDAWDEGERRNDLFESIEAKAGRLREIREQLPLFDEPAQATVAERSTMPVPRQNRVPSRAVDVFGQGRQPPRPP